MALLHSLQIRGIRSFSPENTETIYFNTPVTLFLGQNGSGKTTIIESIRYALTSELPAGTSNGQGFLNDPKISNKSSTKASIKIKFLDSQANEVTVSRFMQVTTAARGSLSFKRIGVNVRRREKGDTGKPTDISGRCIDIDSYCSSSLNVSKSILNNVIFCHQENSAWPLDEPKKLKEKFDEIFDAVRYNKCIEVLRKYIKEKQVNVKVIKERLAFKKSIKDEAEKKRAKYQEKLDKTLEIKEKIKEKQADLKPMEDRIKEILDLEVSLGGLQKELTGKEAEKKSVVEQQNNIRGQISHVFEGSDDELRNKIGSFQEEQETEKSMISDLEKRSREISFKIAEINEKIQKVQIKIGELKEEQKQHNQKMEEIKALIQKAAFSLEITVSSDITDNKLLISSLQKAIREFEKAFEDLVKEKDAEEKQLQNEIDDVREKCASTKQMISSKNGLLREYEKKIGNINVKLEELDTSDSQLSIIDDNIKKHQTTLTNLKKSFNETEKLREVEEIKDSIQEKEKFVEKLEKEYRILQQNYSTEQELDRQKALVIEKQGEINRIKIKHQQNFEELFAANIPERGFKKSVVEIQNREEAKSKLLTKKVNQLQKEVTTLETNVKHQQDKLDSTLKELEKDKKKVTSLCSGRPFNEVLTENYNKKEKLQKDKGQYSSAKIMYETFITKLEKESPCCPICQTDFKNRSAYVKEIVQQLRNKIENIPMQLRQTEKELKAAEDFYNNLQQLKPVNDNIELLTNAKIPLMEEESINLRNKLETSTAQLETEREKLATCTKIIEKCKAVITDVPLLDQYLSDIEKSKNLTARLESNIVSVSSNRSTQETEAEIDSAKAELKNLRNQYEMKKTMIDSHRDRCQKLNNDIQKETQKQIDMQKLVQEKPLLEIQKTEYMEKLMTLRTEIEELKDKVRTLDEELTKVVEKRQNVVSSNRKLKEEKRNEVNSIKNTIQEIVKIQKQIDVYVKNNSSVKLEEAIADLAEHRTKEQNLENAKVTVTNAISEKKQNLAKQQTNFRALKDNELLREKQKLETQLEAEIAVLKKKIGNYNVRSIYDEKQRTQKSIDLFQRDISSLNGQMDEIRKQMTEIKEDLNKPENKHAYKNYMKQCYDLKVHEVTILDLTNYVNVLERSVLQFHKERMVQINKTIRELWRDIYRGNDVDYIEIKTDESMTGGVNKRRSYNYKVVQVKKGVELEMRGRCSAGQKVLACLVIRIALAETFSAHCGILALDEPTTNLDRENILSLSDALARIINTREKEKNFQLLIITHDEEFLNTLSRVQSLESYWKVKRNDEGFSTIQKQYL